MPRCEKEKSEGGLLTKTFTATEDDTVECKIGGRTDLRHVVWVKNLRSYITRVKCSGVISQLDPIRFVPLHEGDIRKSWTSEYELYDYEEHTFPRVGILSDDPNGGEQKIRVEFEIDRHQRGTTESASLQIFVQS